MLNYSKLPERLQAGTQRYIEDGILPGSFLRAVISNNLKESFARADDDNRPVLFDIVKWFYWECPAPAVGSEEKMLAWKEIGGLNGKGVSLDSLKEV